jgi:DNA-binding winged helix-turn-helix (wHTH) protein
MSCPLQSAQPLGAKLYGTHLISPTVPARFPSGNEVTRGPDYADAVPRFRFGDFTLSPRRRTLICRGEERPLIPRYFDLLVFLVERRHEAVHRRDIFDRVWNDVVVSDSALSQAIRTIRRTLGDDPRDPRFIRTLSRHGYRFVFSEVVEEDDEGGWAPAPAPLEATTVAQSAADPYEPLLQRVTDVAKSVDEEEEQREAAELLHALGTAEALRRLDRRPRHAFARALLRDTRWDTADAGPVPIVGEPAPFAVAKALVGLRLRRAGRIAAARWAGASIGGGAAGVVAGTIGGLILSAAPGSAAPIDVAAVLAVIGGACGAVGGAGVGAGLAAAEAIARSQRTISLIAGGALGGGVAGSVAQLLGRWSLAALVGLRVPIGGALEGLAIGAAAGLTYALATSRAEGVATPRGRRRWGVALLVAAACGAAALGLSVAAHPLVGGTVHLIAQASQGSEVTLTPIAALIGEPDFGPATRALIGTGEGAIFGLGLALGLTRRP